MSIFETSRLWEETMLNKFGVMGLAAVIVLAPLTKFTSAVGLAQTDQSTASSASLVGSYKLVASTVKILDSGEVSDTYGKHPSGYLNYSSDGRMLLVIFSDKNDRPAPEIAPSDEQAAKLFRTMAAYGGTYDFDGRTVKHHIDMSWNQTWTGTTQIRDVRKDGDKLVYTTRPAPSPFDGKMSVVTLVWQKVD
jgi:hypothetical protein